MILGRRLALLALTVLPACGDGSASHDAALPDAGPPDVAIPPEIPDLPESFLWGTAIAPYQVEGGLHATDWYQWESLCTACSGESADDGPDFWNRYDVDMAAAEAMHTNTIRLGIEWARVFPTADSFPDSPDPAAVERYHQILQSARDHGLNPMVTLHHFSTPIWIHDLADREARPGWEDPATIVLFAQWAAWAAAEFGGEVDWWITINEPFAFVTAGWIGGVFPPGLLGQIDAAMQVTYNMIEAHARAYDAIHLADTVDADGDAVSSWVSIASHNRVFLPRDPDDPDHVFAANMLRIVNNVFFIEAIVHGNQDRTFDGDLDDPEDVVAEPSLAGRADYIGVNYYGLSLVVPSGDGVFPFAGIPMMNDLDRFDVDNPMSDFGWSIYPEGFRDVLDEMAVYDLPILITENGLADSDDDQRPRFIMDHVYEIGRAIADGVPVRGYYHWSLIDNFEWASGYCPHFGIVKVDFDDPDRARTAGQGADTYRRIIDARNVPEELWREFPGYPPANQFCPRVGL